MLKVVEAKFTILFVASNTAAAAQM